MNAENPDFSGQTTKKFHRGHKPPASTREEIT